MTNTSAIWQQAAHTTSAIWQQAAHTTYQLPSPSCSTRAMQKKSLTLILNKNVGEFSEAKSGEWTISGMDH